MTKPEAKADEGRRSFLKLMGVSAPAAAAAAVTANEADASSAEPEAEGTGLRETAHVKAYLDSARF